ncbi:MAG TPA: hypothetical protein VFB82_14845, partial [Blastocatellia bacterium]|nr:hypothetical protein [Blastocatellia bacterium]
VLLILSELDDSFGIISSPQHRQRDLEDWILRTSPVGLADAADDRAGGSQKSFGFSENWADKILNQFSENSQSRYESAR